MNRRRILTGTLMLVLVAAGIVIGVYAQAPRQSGQPRNPIPVPAPKADGRIPEHVFYEHVFKSLLALKNIDYYRSQAGLDEREAAEFANIASECERELARQDWFTHIIMDMEGLLELDNRT